MREICFRGKRIDNGEWVYGYLICMSHRAWIKDISDKYTNPRRLDGINHTADIRCVEVDPATVGEYTGLHDKNGKEIYEGDIVHCWGGEHCQGYWEHDSKITINNMINDCFMMGEHEFIEVIGNIHENPELLQEVTK